MQQKGNILTGHSNGGGWGGVDRQPRESKSLDIAEGLEGFWKEGEGADLVLKCRGNQLFLREVMVPDDCTTIDRGK